MTKTKPSAEGAYTHVERIEDLAPLRRALERAPCHALDTESNSGFAYQERVALLQLNVGGRLWLVDPIGLEGESWLEALRPALESPDVTTYLHGGEFDVGCLKRDFGCELRGVWDSQQAASFLGFAKTGYGAMVEQICGVELDKAYTQYDWAKRPLEPEVLDYAIDDVRYLPTMCEELKRQVDRADIEEELAIANRVVEEATWDGGFRPDGFWKIKGVGRLDRRGLAVLAALWQWRDEVARAEDRAPGRTLNNRLLLALSANPPRNRGALRRLGVRGRLAARSAELLERVARARDEPAPAPPPREPRAANSVDGREIKRREERLKAWRQKESTRRGVPLQVVLPGRALDHLRRHGANDLERVPQLGPKRIRLYGSKLRELVDSRPHRVTRNGGERAS